MVYDLPLHVPNPFVTLKAVVAFMDIVSNLESAPVTLDGKDTFVMSAFAYPDVAMELVWILLNVSVKKIRTGNLFGSVEIAINLLVPIARMANALSLVCVDVIQDGREKIVTNVKRFLGVFMEVAMGKLMPVNAIKDMGVNFAIGLYAKQTVTH